MLRLRRLGLDLLASFLLPVLAAAPGLHALARSGTPERLPAAPPAVVRAATPPPFDPARPTVVVLLGADVTEITDALGPYEIFARAGLYNVVTAAPERRPTLLSGGLAILPHYALEELDARLGGRPPAVVVVPNIPNVGLAANRPLLEWLRARASEGVLIHSWCMGAKLVAHAGLLDGRPATTHWGDIDGLARDYPRVHWVRGVRWVDDGQFVLSAGITSGIDASLHVLIRLAGEDVARRVAREMRYPDFHFALDPHAPQYTLEPADFVLLADAAWGPRRQIGLGLYPGAGELDVSNLYDAHGYTMAAEISAVSERSTVIHTAHGLTLLPSIVLSSAGGQRRARDLDRLLVPGTDAPRRAASLVAAAAERAPSLRPEYVHAREPHRFGLEPVLEDLARTSDVATARLAQRRMEYRATSVRLRGPAAPWPALVTPIALALVGLWARRAASLAVYGARARRARRDPGREPSNVPPVPAAPRG